jgi:maleylacetate reductase
VKFVHQTFSSRVVFESGSRHLVRRELEQLGFGRALVLSTPQQQGLAEEVAVSLGALAVGVHAQARMHVPVATAQEAAARVRSTGAEVTVAVGGGSTIGLAKSVALLEGTPSVVIPTTYAGSEMTPLWGMTESGAKRTGRNDVVVPRVVLYDPELTTTLPGSVTLTSALNCVAHAAEALYAPDRSPITNLMAEATITSALKALPDALSRPDDLAARSQLLYAAWLGGSCLGTSTMGLHHKLCHTLGGALDLPHSDTHTVILPYALAYNFSVAPAPTNVLAIELNTTEPLSGLRTWIAKLGGPTSLAELGVTRAAIAGVVDQAMTASYPNPSPVEHDRLTRLLELAVAGDPPERLLEDPVSV